jgi:nucleoside-diphosphate-sugar epimerase
VLLAPTTHYGVFKCCNEGNARIYFQDHGVSSIGLRPWTVYGVGRDFGMTSEPTKAIKSLALSRPYHIFLWRLARFAVRGRCCQDLCSLPGGAVSGSEVVQRSRERG